MICNQLEDAVGVKEGVGVPEPEHLVAVLGEDRGSARIILDHIVVSVLATIELDDEVSLATGKVGDEGADGLLPDEPEAEEPSIAQAGPELALGVGRIDAQGFGCFCGELGFEDAHGIAP